MITDKELFELCHKLLRSGLKGIHTVHDEIRAVKLLEYRLAEMKAAEEDLGKEPNNEDL